MNQLHSISNVTIHYEKVNHIIVTNSVIIKKKVDKTDFQKYSHNILPLFIKIINFLLVIL